MGVRLADIHLSQTLRKAGALCTGYDNWGFCVKLSKPFVLKPSVNQYRSIHSGNAANGQITSECSGYDETSNEYLRYVNPEGVEMISVSSSSDFTIVNWVVTVIGYKLPVIVV
ncbi:hypothetical protein DVH24_021794 [Malus domestica]|uniref:Uncharacterized protein n=1 Tax=Malus domestica TaxID=3750 RepID=A0A498IZ00_MALDO|nr:hypothetical protein DVH24_021794 [Malus domestica]